MERDAGLGMMYVRRRGKSTYHILHDEQTLCKVPYAKKGWRQRNKLSEKMALCKNCAKICEQRFIKPIEKKPYLPSRVTKTRRQGNIVTDYDGKQYDVTQSHFLQSKIWKHLRMQHLARGKSECICCGNTRDRGAILCVDHIKPRAKYPQLALDLNNLQTLCAECNEGKGNWLEKDFR